MSWWKMSKWYDGYDDTSREPFNSIDKAVLDKFESFEEVRKYLPEELLYSLTKITLKTAVKIILYKEVYGSWPSYEHFNAVRGVFTRNDLSAGAYEMKMRAEGRL